MSAESEYVIFTSLVIFEVLLSLKINQTFVVFRKLSVDAGRGKIYRESSGGVLSGVLLESNGNGYFKIAALSNGSAVGGRVLDVEEGSVGVGGLSYVKSDVCIVSASHILFVVVNIHGVGVADLFQPVGAFGTLSPLACLLQGRQQHGGEDGDNGNNNEQLNQRES